MDGKVCLTDLVEAALRGEYGDMSVKTGVGAPGHVGAIPERVSQWFRLTESA